jgi:hypothetical protein
VNYHFILNLVDNLPFTSVLFCFSTACTAGQYASSRGSLGCKSCAAGYWSSTKAVLCDLAASDYYLVPVASGGGSDSGSGTGEGGNWGAPNTSAPCPANAVCAGGRQAPVPDRGWWVDRSRYQFAGELYRCSRSTCQGGRAMNASCFAGDVAYPDYYRSRKRAETTPAECVDRSEGTALLCTEGALGYLW